MIPIFFFILLYIYGISLFFNFLLIYLIMVYYKNQLQYNRYNRIDSVESFRFDSVKWIQIVIAKN